MRQRFCIKVGQEAAGLRLDAYLAQRCTQEDVPVWLKNTSRSQLQQAIQRGCVFVDEKRVPARTVLQVGMQVCVEGEEASTGAVLQAESLALDVLYEDADIMVINKAAGMAVHPGAGCVSGTLVHALLGRGGGWSSLGGPERPGIVHRLDKDTSGVMLVAKNNVMHAALSGLFASRQVRKTYAAFAYGALNPPKGVWDSLFARHPSSRVRFSSRVKEGKHAQTAYETHAYGHGLSEVWVYPRTGRTHQIRVHMADAGHPIVGDPLYGGRQWMRIKDAGMRHMLEQHLHGQALHAWKVLFQHPFTGVEMAFEAPWPELLRKLSAYTQTGLSLC
jgi:23S rRNA pseudouridine1911/1915/1917 synthase